jgi:hypothetical protein
MKYSLNSLKETVELILNKQQQQQFTNRNASLNLDDSTLRNEIQTIKNLLLNRSQFPSLPNVTPVLPSWQLVLIYLI